MTEPDEDLSPVERRLFEHLALVRAAPPRETSLVHGVLRRARIQRALREPLRAIATIASAVIEGVAGLFGIRRSRRR